MRRPTRFKKLTGHKKITKPMRRPTRFKKLTRRIIQFNRRGRIKLFNRNRLRRQRKIRRIRRIGRNTISLLL
jgi:hypothetical protein